MSYARAGGWTIDGEIRITAAIAHGLETLIRHHLNRFGGKDEQDDEALKTIAAVVADRLEDMAEDAKRYVEADSVDYRELERLAAIGREVELDRKFEREEAAAAASSPSVGEGKASRRRRVQAG